MPRYVIERNLPGAGKLTPEEIRGVAQKSCGVLKELGSDIQWLESYVTEDKIYCVYVAPDEALIREHAKRGGFPADRISQVKRQISPLTAEGG
jgi:cell division inhibitor SulA